MKRNGNSHLMFTLLDIKNQWKLESPSKSPLQYVCFQWKISIKFLAEFSITAQWELDFSDDNERTDIERFIFMSLRVHLVSTLPDMAGLKLLLSSLGMVYIALLQNQHKQIKSMTSIIDSINL